jgi:RNA polymerase sigma-70 factor (ECF subfamily)
VTDLSTLDDERLMGRYIDGDRGAFSELFRRFAPRLHGWFLRTTGSEPLAQDMVQQTFLHVHRARHDFARGAPVRPWVFAIAANVRRQHHRTRQRKPETFWDADRHREPSVGPGVSTGQDRAVRAALEELSEAAREVVVLHWYEGMSFPEIASVVGASHSAVKVRAHRAYKQLRGILGARASNDLDGTKTGTS